LFLFPPPPSSSFNLFLYDPLIKFKFQQMTSSYILVFLSLSLPGNVFRVCLHLRPSSSLLPKPPDCFTWSTVGIMFSVPPTATPHSNTNRSFQIVRAPTLYISPHCDAFTQHTRSLSSPAYRWNKVPSPLLTLSESPCMCLCLCICLSFALVLWLSLSFSLYLRLSLILIPYL